MNMSARDKVPVTFPIGNYSSQEGTDVVTRAPSAFPIIELKPDCWAPAQQQQRAEEDRYQAKQIGPFRYFAVFDGHGGSKYKGPDHVVDYAVDHLHERLAFKLYKVNINSAVEVIETIKKTFLDFDAELHNNELRFGSTCTMILVHDEARCIYQINLGDSRSLIFNRTNIISITKDHNPSDPEELERIKAAEGSVYFGRIDGSIAISRAFGDFEFKGNRTGMYEPIKGKISAVPTVKVIPIVHSMFILLTSDSPFENGHFTNESLINLTRAELEAQRPLYGIAKNLVASVIKVSTDDTTILLVYI